MKAAVFDGRLRFEARYPDPVPGTGEALIRVELAGISAVDEQIVAGRLPFRGVLGREMIGMVVSGPGEWRGKRVVGEINCVCGSCDRCSKGLANHCRRRTVMGESGREGCFAEYVALPVRNLHLVPDAVSDEEAVMVEPLAAAYQVLVQCPVDSRQGVAVVGSGRLGILVAQVLRAAGCRLTVYGRNPVTLLHCEKRGIHAVHVDERTERGERDVVVECTGTATGLATALELVRPRGRVVLKGMNAEAAAIDLSPTVANEVQMIGSRCGPFVEALHGLARKVVDVRSMISRTFPIEQVVDAFAAAGRPDVIKVLLGIPSR